MKITTLKQGNYQVDLGLRGGTRQRITVSSLREAEDLLREAELQDLTTGSRWKLLPQTEKREIFRVRDEIRERGLAWKDIVGFLDQLGSKFEPICADKATRGYEVWLRKRGCRPRYIEDAARAARKLCREVKAKTTRDLTPAAIQAWLGKQGMKPTTLQGTVGRVASFSKYLTQHHHILQPLITNYELPKTDQRVPEILSNEQLRELLAKTPNHLWNYIVLTGLFGVRPNEVVELAKLPTDTVFPHPEFFVVPPEAAKTRRQRACLYQIGRYNFSGSLFQNEPLIPENLSAKLRRVRQSLSYPWVQDVLRHTAVSHTRMETTPGECAKRMGHDEATADKSYIGNTNPHKTQEHYKIWMDEIQRRTNTSETAKDELTPPQPHESLAPTAETTVVSFSFGSTQPQQNQPIRSLMSL